MMEELLKYNEEFVKNQGGVRYRAGKYPKKKLAVLTCMDTRLVKLLPAALGIENGDVKMVKNAGGLILDEFDSSVRSLLIAVIELGVEEIMVIGHTDCGVGGLKAETFCGHLMERGIAPEVLKQLKEEGLNFEQWFSGFSSEEESVRKSVTILREHPLMPEDVKISGFVMNTESGEIRPAA